MLPSPTFVSSLVEVKPSPVHGRGVFALQDMKKGTRLCDYKGTEIHITDYCTKYGKDRRYSYSMRPIHKLIDGKNHITENPSHYMNESLTPQVKAYNRGFILCCDVKCGDELFLKYPERYPRDYTLHPPTPPPVPPVPTLLSKLP
jgi:hypothetical protein